MSGPDRWCEGCGDLAREIDRLRARIALLEAAVEAASWLHRHYNLPSSWDAWHAARDAARADRNV